MNKQLIILLIVIYSASSNMQYNRSLWPDDNYEKVSLLQPKFKSKQVFRWYGEPSVERSGTQERHLEWFDGSEEDSQSADDSENGLIAEVLGTNDGTSKEEMSKEDLRQHHRKKYVKVNKMLLPLLLAYKLKFFTMIPLLIGALTLLVGTTGLAGFFFALFAAAAGLHAKGGHH